MIINNEIVDYSDNGLGKNCMDLYLMSFAIIFSSYMVASNGVFYMSLVLFRTHQLDVFALQCWCPCRDSNTVLDIDDEVQILTA